MAFVNPYMLLGGLLVAAPIVLHLVLRKQPKHVEFPALRFLKQRHQANRRRLRLKHWLLLLLRCGVILLLAAALARPSVASALVGNWILIAVLGVVLLLVAPMAALGLAQPKTRLVGAGLAVVATALLAVALVLFVRTLRHDAGVLIGDQQAPVAAVLVFDTSPRMEYRHKNQTRLEKAKGIAHWLIRQLPDGSDVAVLNSGVCATVFSVDLGAAATSIASLEPTGVPRPLPEVIADATDLIRTSQKTRKELYVFTDATQPAWNDDSAGRLRSRLDDAKDVLVFLIDVGMENPRNFALGEVRLSGEIISRNAAFQVQTQLQHIGPGGDRAVELYLEEPDNQRPLLVDGEVLLPKSRRRSRQSCRVGTDGSQTIQFDLRGLEPGTHQGRIRIVGEDNLAVDDVRYFTIEVREAWPVLVARGRGADATYLTEALAPYEFRQSHRSRFRCETVSLDDLADKELDSYAATCLLDPGPLAPNLWRNLTAYTERGGSVAIFLGRNARPDNMSQEAARKLLPGTLTWQWPRRRTRGPAVYLAPREYQHPMLASFRPVATSVPWRSFPVYRHWMFGDLDPTASAILHFDNNQPALLEEVLDKGRVVVMTTPVSDAANVPGRREWNRLATGINAWPFLLLARGILLDLVRSGDTHLNYLAGQRAVLHRRSDTEPDRYQLFTPQGGSPQEIPAQKTTITVRFTDTIGAYRLKPNEAGHPVRGFCVNLPPAASDLRRATSESLDRALGPKRYQVFSRREEITPGIGEARSGREFYPPLLAALGLFLALEYTMANRFYRKDEDNPSIAEKG